MKLGILALVEHKSYPDKDVSRQILRYLAGLYETRKHVIIPMVLYHGKTKWTIPTNFASCLDIPDDLRDILMRYVPEFSYDLLDLRDEKTDINYFSFAVQAFLQTLRDIWFLEDKKILKFLFKDYFQPINKEHQNLLADLRDYIIYDRDKPDFELIVEYATKYISKEAGESFMTIAEQLEKKGIEKGIEKGRQEGIEKGKREAAVRMLAKGFSIADISDITGLSEEQIRSL